MPAKPIHHLPALVEKYVVNAIVETPQGSRHKFDYDPKTGLFALGAPMPAGSTFPFDFGFIPSTIGEDGDPLDVLILMDAGTFTGCLAKVRLIGVIEAKQSNDEGKMIRNDRLIGVADVSRRHCCIHSFRDLPGPLVEEIEHFFTSYNELKERKFKILGCFGRQRARRLVKAGIRAAKDTQ
jgi:inorganic pyrophosphatase